MEQKLGHGCEMSWTMQKYTSLYNKKRSELHYLYLFELIHSLLYALLNFVICVVECMYCMYVCALKGNL